MNTDQVLIEKFISEHPSMAAWVIEKLKDEEIATFISKYPVELNVQIISWMRSYKAAKCLEMTAPELAVQILEKMDLRDGELLIRQCNEDFRNKMLNALPSKHAAVLRQAIAHRDNSVGAYMKPVISGLRKKTSVQEAIATLKQEKELRSPQIYIVDEQVKLEGIVKMHDLLTAENDIKLSSIMITDIPKFFADTNIESVANHPGWYEFQDIPVINGSEKLIGALNINSLKNNTKEKVVANHIIETSNALGELYRIGLTGFLQSISK